MKKIISLFTVFILALNSFSLVYAEDDFYSREKRLTTFGVLDGEKERSPLAKVTKEDYWSAVVNIFVFGGEAQSSEGLMNIAESLGLVENTESTTIKSAVSFYDLVKNEVNLLGYDKYMNNFSDKSYLAQAKSLGLLKNISLTGNGSLTWYNAVILLENFMNASTREYDISLMEDMAHIYKARGIVNANELTSLYGTRAGKNEIIIGDVTVKTDKLPEARNYIGKSVEAYLKQDVSEKDYTLLYIEERQNNIKVFENADDLSVDAGISKFSYFEGDKEKTYRISPSVKVIFNDVLYTDYTAADLVPKSGTVTAIDNNSDSTYDVIVVESYEILPVGSIAQADMKVVSKYTFDGALRNVKLKAENDEDFIFIYKDGAKAEFTDIKADSVLSVKRNKSGDVNVISVYISDKKLNGKLNSIKSDGKLNILDSDIKTSYAYDAAVAKNDTAVSKAEIGKTYDVYLDIMGEIALMKEAEKTNNYAWLLKLGREEGMDPVYRIKYMDTDGIWQISELNSKVKLNGTRKTDDAVYNEIYDNGSFTPQVITVNLNKDGKVAEIETARENAPEGYEYLTKTKPANRNLIYRFTSTFNFEIFLSGSANIFIIPQTLTFDEDDYSVGTPSSVLEVNYGYAIEGYNCDKYGFTDLITVVRNDRIDNLGGSSRFIVLEKGNRLDGDGGVVTAVTGNMDTYTNIWITGENGNEFDNITEGDIISFQTVNGKAKNVKKLATLSNVVKTIPEDPAVPGIDKTTDINGHNAVTAGTVVDCDAANNRVRVDAGNATRTFVMANSGYYEYSVSRNTLKSIAKEDIEPDDTVVIFTWESWMQNVYKVVK